MFQLRAVLAGTLALALLAGCQRTQVEQRGYRGLGMLQNARPQALAALAENNEIPKPLRKVSAAGPRASETYQNVQLLGDLSKPEFARLMLSFKRWLAPDEGCNYCHNAPDYASDAKYPKLVARAMIAMTRHINSDWKDHVKATGVTCWTCHRGQGLPAKTWYRPPSQEGAGMMRVRTSARLPTAAAATTALPVDALTDYLLDAQNIRINGPTPLQTGNPQHIRNARSTYSLMMVMSESLGVNCTFCHNARAFASWELSTPQRVQAWYGIRMARDLNAHTIEPLAALLPKERLGPTGDAPKVYCATCHQGARKPMNGISMIGDFPELVAPPHPNWGAASAPAAAPTPAASAGQLQAAANQPVALAAAVPLVR